MADLSHLVELEWEPIYVVAAAFVSLNPGSETEATFSFSMKESQDSLREKGAGILNKLSTLVEFDTCLVRGAGSCLIMVFSYFCPFMTLKTQTDPN